ncbi:MAG: efflux RND transporter permease subunit, partial [Gammaproteobacteria bacterium]
MTFTDLFIRRPVVAISISCVILLAGLWSLLNLPLSLYPQVVMPIVEVNTIFPGASPEVIQNYVTSELQTNLSGIDGVDYVTSTSSTGMSKIDLYFHLGQNLDQAVSTVMRKVQAVAGLLPAGTFAPTISAGESNNYYFFLQATSSRSSLEWVTDYLERVTVP